jgi:hypothetical protein
LQLNPAKRGDLSTGGSKPHVHAFNARQLECMQSMRASWVIHTNKGKSLLLFGYSLRSFKGAELNPDKFFPFFQKNRINLINALGSYNLPTINIKE